MEGQLFVNDIFQKTSIPRKLVKYLQYPRKTLDGIRMRNEK